MALEDYQRRPDGTLLRRISTREFLDHCPTLIADFFHYWDSLRQGRAMPRRADFRPEAMVRQLSGLLLIDVEGLDSEGKGIYRYRVVGTEEVRLRGHDPTGKLVQDGFFWSSLEDALACYETIRRTQSYLYQNSEFISTEGRWRAEHAIIVPFSDDGESVTQIMVYSLARSARER